MFSYPRDLLFDLKNFYPAIMFLHFLIISNTNCQNLPGVFWLLTNFPLESKLIFMILNLLNRIISTTIYLQFKNDAICSQILRIKSISSLLGIYTQPLS